MCIRDSNNTVDTSLATAALAASRNPNSNQLQNVESRTNGRMTRITSRESMSTLVGSIPSSDGSPSHNRPPIYAETNDNSDQGSLFTTLSDETMINQIARVLRLPVTTFTRVREFPLISTFLHSGVLLFSSMAEYEKYRQGDRELAYPILQTTSSKLNIFKMNSPILTICRYKLATEKFDYCKVYFKIYSTHINYYVLKFNHGDDSAEETVLLLNNNSHQPTVDFELEDSKFRIVGVTGTSSTFGTHSLIKVFVMKNNANLLTNDITVLKPEDHHKTRIKIGDGNQLLKVIEKQDRMGVNQQIEAEQPLVPVPLVTFVDEGSKKLEKNFLKNGTIKLFDYQEQLSEEAVKLATIVLVLREQEYRKYKGDNKPSYVK